MIEGHCDLNILLDLFFLHYVALSEKQIWYPGLRRNTIKIPNLITALSLADIAEPWRSQYRYSIAKHPGLSITRICGKCFPSFLRDRLSVVILFVEHQFPLSFNHCNPSLKSSSCFFIYSSAIRLFIVPIARYQRSTDLITAIKSTDAYHWQLKILFFCQTFTCATTSVNLRCDLGCDRDHFS